MPCAVPISCSNCSLNRSTTGRFNINRSKAGGSSSPAKADNAKDSKSWLGGPSCYEIGRNIRFRPFCGGTSSRTLKPPFAICCSFVRRKFINSLAAAGCSAVLKIAALWAQMTMWLKSFFGSCWKVPELPSVKPGPEVNVTERVLFCNITAIGVAVPRTNCTSWARNWKIASHPWVSTILKNLEQYVSEI